MTINKKTVIALGMFDGVHMGHRKLLQTAAALAQSREQEALAYTFSNHPMSVFAVAPPLIMTLEERVAAIRNMGISRVETPMFTKELAALAPEAFVDMLLNEYHMGTAVVGFNYTFGSKGAGTAKTLFELGQQKGFLVETVPAVYCGGQEVSSTGIRRCLEAGDAAAAAALLGEPYAIRGVVSHNRHIGTTLGFPTANLTPPAGKLLPRFGVYATVAQVNGAQYPAVTNVGNNPTVQGKGVTIETHILHNVGNVYEKPLCVRFLSWLREEKRFSGKAALAQQIEKDVKNAGICFKSIEF